MGVIDENLCLGPCSCRLDHTGPGRHGRSGGRADGLPDQSHEFPGGGLCNDIALKGQGANKDAYVTDTKNGRVLKLAPGSDAFTVWYVNDKSDPSLDGLVWKGDTLYTNTYNGNHVIAVPMKAEGSTAYVLEAKLNYQRDPALKGKDPGTFTAYAVPLK